MATNQQPNQPRPWLRLTSLAARTNIPTPAPPPAPAPAPVLRPALRPQAQQPQPPAAVPPPALIIRPALRPPAPAPEAKPTEPRPDQARIQLAPPPTTSPVKQAPTNGAVKAVGASRVTPPTSPPKPEISSLKPTSPPTGRPAATEKPSPTALSRSLKPAAESPPHSPPRKTTAPPPSPLTLPPAQLKAQEKLEPPFPMEAEQKTVLVQKTVGKPSNSHLDGKNEPPMKHADKKEKAHHKKPSSDSDEGGVRVITIAGENRGAFMELIKSPRQKGFEGHPHHLQKKAINDKPLSDAGSEYHSYSSSDEAKQHRREMHHKAPAPMNAYMNSNVQGINNSIVYNSSYTHHDPGVHAAFSKKPSGSGGGFYGTERRMTGQLEGNNEK